MTGWRSFAQSLEIGSIAASQPPSPVRSISGRANRRCELSFRFHNWAKEREREHCQSDGPGGQFSGKIGDELLSLNRGYRNTRVRV